MPLERSPLYPFTSRYLDRDGLRYHYVDEGAGEPIVMLHGNPTWSFFYRNLILALRDRYRTIAPDHIGCGPSDKPGDDRYRYTLASRVDDVERLLEHLDVRDNITLVLHDWGGMIGMAYASRHPECIKRLVILNTAAFLLPASKKLPWSLWLCGKSWLAPLLVRGLNAFCLGLVASCAERRLSDEVRSGYLAPYRSWHERIAVLRFVQDIPLRPGDEAYALVKSVQDGLDRFKDVPMLICWGEKDFVFDQHFLGEWRRRFPQAEVHAFPDAGHLVLEDAGSEITARIGDFLSRHP